MAKESPLHRIFCKNLRSIRVDRGLTQVEMADRLKVTQPSYCAIETGKSPPNLETIERLSLALGCNPTDLLSAEKFEPIA